MREILFRGQRVDNKELVYGYVFPVVINEVLRYFIIPCDTYCPKHITIKELQVEVIPKTIGQFTGLTDKNGVKIFVDDIYQDEEGDVFKVVQMRCGRYALQMLDNNYTDELIDWSEVEIIGNIHE